jgi:hypothetical protein
MWTRNTCKYGDNFVYLKLDPEKGVVGVQQLPTIEIERHEVGVVQKISTDITKELDKDKKAFTLLGRIKTWNSNHGKLLTLDY